SGSSARIVASIAMTIRAVSKSVMVSKCRGNSVSDQLFNSSSSHWGSSCSRRSSGSNNPCEPSLNVLAVMKPVRSGPLSTNPTHPYGDPASKRGSCIPEAHSGQPN
ncbi:hypothetical protein Tco_1158165, partial [Tanacetum coccineum]